MTISKTVRALVGEPSWVAKLKRSMEGVEKFRASSMAALQFAEQMASGSRGMIARAKALANQAVQSRARLGEVLKTWDRDAAWLLSHGWPPLMDAPVNAAGRLRRACKGKGENASRIIVDEVIVGFYDENRIRQEMLIEWEQKPFLEHRMHILRSAAEAHIQSKYALSVPALLPQIEGIVAENFAHSGHLKWDKFIAYMNQMMPSGNLDGFEPLFRQFIIDMVLADFERGAPLPYDLNRHAILHGADVNYATPVVSLKALLVIDFMVDLIAFVATDNSSSYHRPECGHLRRTSRPRRVYPSEFHALGDRKAPCRVCCKNSQYHGIHK